MSGERLDVMEVQGAEIRCPIEAPKRERVIEPMEMVKELKEIINQKNAVIEKQTDYISELQEENSRLRQMVQLLNM